MRRHLWTTAAGTTIALALGLSNAAAQGCGPTRLKVVESVALAVPPARAWALLGDFQNMSWDADVAVARGSGGNVPDVALRTVTLRDGATLAESLYKYDADAMSYSYHLDRVDLAKLPIQNASATLEVVSLDGGKASTVRWKVAFYRNLTDGEGAPDAADARAAEAVARMLRTGLAGLDARVPPRS